MGWATQCYICCHLANFPLVLPQWELIRMEGVHSRHEDRWSKFSANNLPKRPINVGAFELVFHLRVSWVLLATIHLTTLDHSEQIPSELMRQQYHYHIAWCCTNSEHVAHSIPHLTQKLLTINLIGKSQYTFSAEWMVEVISFAVRGCTIKAEMASHITLNNTYFMWESLGYSNWFIQIVCIARESYTALIISCVTVYSAMAMDHW